MPRTLVYQCPDCNGRFNHIHDPSDSPPPDTCPLCHYDATPLEQQLPMPRLSSARARSVDGHYRAMEEASDHRATLAQGMGLSEAEAAGLRMTNMKDGLREGESAEITVNNEVSRQVEAAPSVWGFQQAQGVGYSNSVSQGAFPNAGAFAMQNIVRKTHQRLGNVVTDTPAIETQNPLYRRRT